MSLPKHKVRFTTHKPTTIAEVRGIMCNPIYAGVGPYPALVDDETWVSCAAKLIREEGGAEQFLVDMLHMLRASWPAGSAVPGFTEGG